MPAERSTAYTIGFAAAVCIVCSVLVAVSAVSLAERQADNRTLDRQRNVLLAAGLLAAEQELTAEQIRARFAELIGPREVELPGDAGTRTIYEVTADGRRTMVVLPVEGPGLWSTLYGFLAVDADGTTVRGIAFYDHGETPGLGGEVDNPRWRNRWHGRRLFDDAGGLRLEVIKGVAGDPADDPHRVDGLSGATMTARGVSALVRRWVGADGFGPYLEQFRRAGGER
jgi:Na+-transporting NADH:ubiquinone oxidoreductase subunit C